MIHLGDEFSRFTPEELFGKVPQIQEDEDLLEYTRNFIDESIESQEIAFRKEFMEYIEQCKSEIGIGIGIETPFAQSLQLA